MNLFSPFKLRDCEIGNRIAVSPMSQYIAEDGFASDWHLVHLGRFALGGAGLVFTEATAVEERGRRTHGDLGLWKDEQIEPLARITHYLAQENSTPGIQLAHAGRKASERRPWHGETPVNEEDIEQRNEAPWQVIGPSAIPYAEGWHMPEEMSRDDIDAVLEAFAQAARRADLAGFGVIEVYAAHGFLEHQFYSPIANQRQDDYGGSFENRIRFTLETAQAVRRFWPEQKPLIFRLSATDWIDGGWELEDTIALAKRLKAEGVDMIDCSTGGIGGSEKPRRMPLGQGFQLPFAAEVKKQAEIATMGVGFLWDAEFANQAVVNGEVDMLALARELLDHPNWPLQAAQRLGLDENYARWRPQFGWWLDKRQRISDKLGLR